MSLKIILDSNFLFVPLKFRIDIFKELETIVNRKVEVIVLSPIYEELKILSLKDGVNGKEARIALEYANKCRLVQYETRPNEIVDDFVVRIAEEWRCLVATNDRALRKKLRQRNIPVIYLRQKSHLAIYGNLLGREYSSNI